MRSTQQINKQKMEEWCYTSNSSNLSPKEQCCTNTNSNLNLVTNQTLIDNNTNHIDYFPLWNKEVDWRAGAKLTKPLYDEFSNIFSGKGCFEGTFSL